MPVGLTGVSVSAIRASTIPTFRPGATGQLAPNEWSDWADLIASVASLPVPPRYIDVDTTDTSPAVIPAGSWDLRGAVLRGRTWQNPAVSVTVADGATFVPGSWSGVEQMTFSNLSTSPIYAPVGVSTLYIRNGATVTNAGAGAAMITPSGVLALVCQNAANLAATATFPIVDGTAASAVVAAYTYGSSIVGVDAIRTSAPGLIAGLVYDCAGRIDAQPTPGLTLLLQGAAARVAYTPSTPADWAGSPADVQAAIDRMAAVVAANFGAIP